MSSENGKSSDRPETVKMQIHTGMLESLGINMYTSIGKSLVEFIANGFDAEATTVEVNIPFEAIESARKTVRDDAKKAHAEGLREDFKRVYESLPDDIEISIEDTGHGMTVEEIESKFLVVNRDRRKVGGDKSESGLRSVMGRKGLGKLAGFGVAEKVIVRTKRRGETYATTITMDFNEIKGYENIGDVKFQTVYEEGLAPELQGTAITLQRLRCDSLKYKKETIEAALAQNFFITGDDFKVFLNGMVLDEPDVDYEFVYPGEGERVHDGFAQASVEVHDDFDYPVDYLVKFRARGSSAGGKIRGSLPAYLRGARVYCNQRLAAGPTLFNLETGMHNFHAQSYMECIVHADVLDQQEADLIGTNRSALKTDNEVIDAFVTKVTDLMRKAIYAHSKFRDGVVDEEMKNDPISRAIIASVDVLPARNREPAKKLLRTLAVSEGVDSPIYQEVAPHLVKAINSSEVLIELIKSGLNPSSLGIVIDQLTELAQVEKSDVLKLYRARRHGIDALQLLEERSHEERGPRYEEDLQDLLKHNSWLIRAEYSNHLTSDDTMAVVAKKLDQKLGIDSGVKSLDTAKDKRPDLVFVLVNTESPSVVEIVELKSPNVDLTMEHLTQLKGYIMDVEAMLENDYGPSSVKVTGHLIGNMPRPDSQSRDAKLLMKEIKNAGANAQWEIITLPQLLDRARTAHMGVIDALEAEEEAQN